MNEASLVGVRVCVLRMQHVGKSYHIPYLLQQTVPVLPSGNLPIDRKDNGFSHDCALISGLNSKLGLKNDMLAIFKQVSLMVQ